MIPTCTRCATWIEHGNHGHPGYCSPRCRDAARADRDEMLAEQAAQRRAARDAANDKCRQVLT